MRVDVAGTVAGTGRTASPALLIFGTGYASVRVARRSIGLGFDVFADWAHASQLDEIRAMGVEPLRLDGSNNPLLSRITHVLSTVPPKDGYDPVLSAHPRLLQELPALRWSGYFSAVDVYKGGSEWVDESTTALPQTMLGRVRLLAEREWVSVRPATHIFRLGQVYGPGRSALAAVRGGSPTRVRREGYVRPLVHVDDLADLVARTMIRPAGAESPAAPSYYNVVDEEPAAPADELGLAAELLGLPPPPEVPPALRRGSTPSGTTAHTSMRGNPPAPRHAPDACVRARLPRAYRRAYERPPCVSRTPQSHAGAALL